jgi:hypothetical protein
MYHPMKALERKWNAHTPKFLHNGSKENIIFQLALTALFLLGFYGKDWLQERSRKREEAAYRENYVTNLSDYASRR